MFCPNCGAQLPDGSPVCGYCGNQLSAQPTNQVSITEFDKKAGKLIPITFILTLVLLVTSVILPLTSSIFDIPVVDMALNMAGDAIDDIEGDMDDVEDAYEELEWRYEMQEDSLPKSARNDVKKMMKATKKLIKKPSILNFQNFFSVAEDVSDDLDEEHDILGVSSITKDVDDAKGIMGILIGVAVGMFVLPGIFTVLGGLLKSKGLTITALVFMVLSQLILCGILWVILSLLVYIAQAILCHKAKKAKLHNLCA